MLDEKHKEIERLNEEWQEASKKLAEANKARCAILLICIPLSGGSPLKKFFRWGIKMTKFGQIGDFDPHQKHRTT